MTGLSGPRSAEQRLESPSDRATAEYDQVGVRVAEAVPPPTGPVGRNHNDKPDQQAKHRAGCILRSGSPFFHYSLAATNCPHCCLASPMGRSSLWGLESGTGAVPVTLPARAAASREWQHGIDEPNL